jgi:hypothetical protein
MNFFLPRSRRKKRTAGSLLVLSLDKIGGAVLQIVPLALSAGPAVVLLVLPVRVVVVLALDVALRRPFLAGLGLGDRYLSLVVLFPASNNRRKGYV